DAFVGPLVARMGAQLVLPRPVRLIPDIKHLSAGAQAWIRRMASDRTVRALAALLAIGLALRFFILRGIWLDEATSIHQATMPFGAMIKDLRNTDVHPPLYFSVLWATDRLFGDGALAMRIPSILAGCVAIPVAYVTGRDLWDRRTGLVAAAMASVAPILVWYSQEIRMYSMFMLFALLALWGQARALRTNRVSDWAIYVLASAALVWTEYFAVFQVIAQQAVFVGVAWRRHGERARRFAVLGVATFVILALVAPLVPFAWHQFMVNQNAGKGFGAPSQVGLAGVQSISVYTVLANLAWAVVGYHSATVMAAVVALWPVGILLALFLLGRRMTENTVAVLGSALVPAVLLLGVGMAKRNLFDVRYMSGVVVALLLLTARLITGGTRDRRFQVAACAMVIAILSLSLGDEQVNGSNPRLYDFAGALHAVLAQARPGDLLMYDPGDLGLVVSYYAPRVHSTTVPAPVSERATPGSEVFVLASPNLMNGSQPSQLGQLLSRLSGTDRAIGTIHRANVTVWVFRVPAPSSAAAPASAVAPSSGGRP
ncbi:MAG TPA: glycosyltransferase family 39 protein, partial [Chloroflexota bacterium]|nr:glycosyltransferase family 39 protein [Chloroflexota bacterium]